MTGIVDYGAGNLFSLTCSLEKIGEQSLVSSDEKVLLSCDRLILPGVGAFADAAQKLKTSGLDTAVKQFAAKRKPLLGICLGMQLLFDKSYEGGEEEGLKLLRGEVVNLSGAAFNLKVPQIGWNSLSFKKSCPLFKYITAGDWVYFVHSYHAVGCDESLAATCNYGKDITAAVAKDNIFGTQFHPEKSGDAGLKILKAFCEL
ncbi:MAG: imidazole glycerol phosphate synthase subunit HisH [Clostridia bacterium]|nr:imidazole glycerol phosphate synthase subunit HisH [Clostridia bacterium]